MSLSERVYCVAIALIMAEWVELQICVKFCIKLEHSSMETIWMIQKAAAMGNWWLAASHDNMPAHVSCVWCRVFCETSNPPGDSTPLQPRFGTLKILAFPKIKITFEKEEILNHGWDSGKSNGAADGSWKNCVRSQGAYFQRTEVSLSYAQCFL